MRSRVVDASAEISSSQTAFKSKIRNVTNLLRPTIFCPMSANNSNLHPLFHIGTTMVRTLVVTVDRDNDLGSRLV